MSTTTRGGVTRHRAGPRMRRGRLVFAKAARAPILRGDLAREAAVYALLRTRCRLTAERLPREARWDPAAGELAMEAVDAPDLACAVSAAGGISARVAEAVGRAVGDLHVEGRGLDGDVPRSAWATGSMDWHRPGPAHLRVLSGGGVELLHTLQRSSPLCVHLAEVARPRGADTLIHGDLRWENALVAPEASPPRVWLVDWELGGQGESAWDVGCFVAACVSGWLATIPHIPGVPPARLVNEATLPIDAVRPGLAAFWAAYLEVAKPERADAWGERCLQLVAARLVHLAFEATDGDEHLRASPVAHLQVALNILERPQRAAHELLGITT